VIRCFRCGGHPDDSAKVQIAPGDIGSQSGRLHPLNELHNDIFHQVINELFCLKLFDLALPE
jgi:hypothetical protein